MSKSFRVLLVLAILLILFAGTAPVSVAHAANTLTVTNSLDSGAGSLRQAILDAMADSGDVIIEFSASSTITLNSQLPVIVGDGVKVITINGKGPMSTVIQASICNPVTGVCTPADYRIFQVDASGVLTLTGLTVRHGNCKGSACNVDSIDGGGGIYNKGSLTISNSFLTGNAAITGGGIYNNGGTVALTNVTFSGNDATYGGGLYNLNSNSVITSSTFSDNSASSNGAGLYNMNSNPTLTDVVFSSNTAPNGGGMYNNASNPVVTGGIFLDNSANLGGGISNLNSTPTITNSTFSNNTAGLQGGGLRNDASSPIISNSTFSGNHAQNGGGIASLNTSNVTISDSTFSGNTVTGAGGGIYSFTGTTVNISHSTFTSNSAGTDGGGLYNKLNSPTIIDSTFLSNSALGSGGGMFNDSGTLTLTNSTFSGNSATANGGGLLNKSVSSPIVTNVTLFGNTAEVNGGGMFNDTSNPIIFNVTFSGNSATTAGGGLSNLNSNPTLKNVILWGDTTTGSGPEINNSGSTPKISYSLVQGSGGSTTWDIALGTDLGNNLDADPLLSPLADNGGLTQTMAVPVGSPVIDKGTNTNCPTPDQRGVTRPFDGDAVVGAVCDIGAFEYINQPPTNINLSKSTVDENLPVATIVGTLSTIDPDAGNTFTYSFCGGTDDASFTIASDTLKTAEIFDYETKASYSVCIKSTDNGNLSTTKTLVISVNDLIDTQTFADVPMPYWAWSYIERLYKAGITGGCTVSPLNYCPEDSVTRAQMAVFLEKGVHFPSPFTAPDVAPTFTDTVGHWAEDWIEALRSDNITGGCATDLYCPDNPVTRAQMAVFLLKSEHGPLYTPPAVGADSGFTDVPIDYWAAAWIKQLAAEGITGGCATDLYCPDDSVTRAQMAVFLVKTFNLP